MDRQSVDKDLPNRQRRSEDACAYRCSVFKSSLSRSRIMCEIDIPDAIAIAAAMCSNCVLA